MADQSLTETPQAAAPAPIITPAESTSPKKHWWEFWKKSAPAEPAPAPTPLPTQPPSPPTTPPQV